MAIEEIIGTRKCTLAALILWTLVLVSTSAYKIGVGRADVTGPCAEIVFLGYARIEQKGEGIHLRLFSRAFIIDDGNERFVFVSVDSAMIGHGLKSEVIRRLKSRFGDLYNDENVLLSGTHTHSSPGGFMMDVLFDLTAFGFVKQTYNALVNGITKSIERAHEAIVTGKIYVAQGEILDANINRSPQAYENNPASERMRYKDNVDKIITQLQFISDAGKEMGVINWFAVHPTSMNNTNHLISSDNVGYASILFEQRMNGKVETGKGSFVAAFASTNLGDVSPNTRGPKCEFSGKNCSVHYTCSGAKERCFASGPGEDMFESTKIIADKLLAGAWELMNSNDTREVTGPLHIVHRYVNMPEQNTTFFNHSTRFNESVRGCLPAMGYSFAAGTTDGPGSSAFEQGTTNSNPFWNKIRNFIAAPTANDISCQSPKPILLATGRMKLPYQWQPKIVSTQLVFLGNVIIAGVPGEFTTMAGRRVRESIKQATSEKPGYENVTVVIAGLSNTYSDYVTTPEEYEIQRYEGASTIFGPHTLTIYLEQYKQLASAIIKGQKVEPGPQPADLSKEPLISFVTPVLFDTPQWGYKFGDCVKQPPKTARHGDKITATFVAGHPRNNLMTEHSFLAIEKHNGGSWITVATDADWETKFRWERRSIILGSSQATVTWNVPDNAEEGEYRIRHNGYYRYILGGLFPYQGISKPFRVMKDVVSSTSRNKDS